MIKILIVEDEPAILNGIKQMILAQNLPVEIVGCCFNGRTALELFDSVIPDIVLTDIKMPVMNGLELIESTRNRFPDVEYIILSGYSDFEYARTAMQYGVNEYILKPSNNLEFKTVIERVCKKVQDKKSMNTRRLMEEIVFNRSCNTAQETFEAEKHSFYYLSILCLGAFSVKSVDSIQPDKAIWNQESIENYLNSKIENQEKCYVIDSAAANEKVVMLTAADKNILSVKRFINKITAYEKATGIPLTIVISEPFSSLKDLNGIYSNARITLSNRIVIGKSNVIIMDRNDVSCSYVAIDNQERQKIQHLLHSENFQGILEEFLYLSEGWKVENIPQNICEFSVKYLISEIYNKFHYLQKKYPLEYFLSKVEHSV